MATDPTKAPQGTGGGAAPGNDRAKTARERAEEKRAEKLEQVREQVQSGSLVIRQMTEDERRRNPPRPDRVKRPGGG